MKVLLTGFTPKSFTGVTSPESHGIMDLNTILPLVLHDLGVAYEFVPNIQINTISQFDRVFIKVWNLDDMISLPFFSMLSELLKGVDINKVILISDHHDPNPAFDSMKRYGGLFGELALLRYTRQTISNLYCPKELNHIDPSAYIPEGHLIFEWKKNKAQAWVIGNLMNEALDVPVFDYPAHVFNDLKETDLLKKIADHGMTYIPEHPKASPYWWRIRYYAAALNGAAVLASERDMKALYGFYLPAHVIEQERTHVARLQGSIFLEKIEPKLTIQKKVKILLS